MKVHWQAFALMPAVAALAAYPGGARAEIDRAAFVSLGGSVLKVEVIRTQGGYSLGSGVVVAKDKLITNCHVTRGADEIDVIQGGVRFRVATQARDVDHDLCLLEVPGMVAEVVKLGRANDLKLGQSVTALGFTGGIGIQNSPGEIVALHRYDGGSVIQSTNWFNSGASGGGLFDDELRLVGILTYRLRGGAAHYYAAPVEWVRRLLEDRQAYREVKPRAGKDLSYWERPVDEQPDFLKAAVMQRDKNWDALRALASAWTRRVADDPEPWYMEGTASFELGEMSEARTALERCVTVEPAFSAGWFKLGVVFVRQGDVKGAKQAHARLEALNPDLAAELKKMIDAL